jgi:hypothetical protein
VVLRNHVPDIAAMDLFIAPTIGFDLLYVFVIVRLERRKLVWINVTPHPTAEWIARQITEAFPWAEAPRYLIRDWDRAYGAAVTRRLRAMGIRDKPIAPGSPWQNGFAERLIGSIRRECVDASHRSRSWVAFTTIIVEFSFRYRQACEAPRVALPIRPISRLAQVQEPGRLGGSQNKAPPKGQRHRRGFTPPSVSKHSMTDTAANRPKSDARV